MITYTTFSTPECALALAASPRGVCHIVMSCSESGAERAVLSRYPEAVRADLFPSLRAQLCQYLAGEPVEFDAPLDLSGITPFGRRVLEACAAIPYGQTRTYLQLAHEVGRPQAPRAVGGALGRNPIPLIIPCHRVVASNGGLGGFSAEQGIALKRRLLELESAGLKRLAMRRAM